MTEITNEQRNFLRRICELQGDEWTEYVTLLLDIDQYNSVASEEFQTAIDREIHQVWTWAHENLEIVKTTKTRTITETFFEVVERDIAEDDK